MLIFASNGWTTMRKLLLLISLSGLANSAFANVCKDDIDALCEAEKGDPKAVMQCLESNKSELSSECTEQVDTMLAKLEENRGKGKGGFCKDAVKEYCSDVRSEGREAVVACLESNKSELSSECAEQVEKMLAQ